MWLIFQIAIGVFLGFALAAVALALWWRRNFRRCEYYVSCLISSHVREGVQIALGKSPPLPVDPFERQMRPFIFFGAAALTLRVADMVLTYLRRRK